jgi:ABC-type iron transport system FetAB ATPase subunit
MLTQIRFQNVFYRDGENTILSNLSLEIEKGDYIPIMSNPKAEKARF